MNALRLVIITSRYWPHMGDVETIAGNLASELVELGALPTVLTAKWRREWPNRMFVGEIPVETVAHPPVGRWNTFRYVRDVGRWLRCHCHRFDAVHVMGMRYEAFAVLGALRGTAMPVTMYASHSGPHSDLHWQEQSRLGMQVKNRCRQADAVVVPSHGLASELVQMGYNAERVHFIAPGTLPGEARTADRRYRSRAALTEANHDLAAAEYAPVVIYAGRFDSLAPFIPLLRAWRSIGARWPSARLWLLGDGRERNALYDTIVGLELKYQVFMPGCFEQLTDVLMAADLFVQPQVHGGTALLLEAMASGLPVIASDSREHRAMMEHGHTGWLVAAEDQQAWTAALTHLCDHPAIAAQVGAAAQRIAEQSFSRRRMAQQHLELFQSLLAR